MAAARTEGRNAIATAVGHPPTEAERLVRLVHRALGDVESAFQPGLADDDVAKVAREIEERARGIEVSQA